MGCEFMGLTLFEQLKKMVKKNEEQSSPFEYILDTTTKLEQAINPTQKSNKKNK